MRDRPTFRAACAKSFDVTGVDRSEDMLARARQRASKEHLNGKLAFYQGDARNLDLGRKFDAALMMFNVLGYMTTNEDLLGALRSVRRHLDENGLFIFDIWCGPALMSSPPGDGTKKFSTEKGAIIRSSSGHIRGHDQCCDIAIRLQKLESDVIVESSEEFHRVRYYFPLEIDLALRVADFRVMAIRRFPEIDKDPDLDVWSAVVVAAAGRPSP